jgi:2-polyprenyl-3-methyl-5-hydroxy-6-metoxy-1,4-benzoquinol methylase
MLCQVIDASCKTNGGIDRHSDQVLQGVIMLSEKFEKQDNQYCFPYHHIPHFDKQGTAKKIRILKWGWEYLCYQLHIKSIVENLEPQSVLEVGCGDGYFIGNLGDDIPHRHGVDLSVRAINFAKAFFPNVVFDAIDARNVDGSFDVVVAIEVLEHVPDDLTTEFIRMLSEKTRDKGHVVISVPTDILPLNKKHYRHYNREMLGKHVAASGAPLKLVSLEYVYKENEFIRRYIKLTCNNFWVCEIESIRRLIWKYIWKYARRAQARNGHHIVATFQKVAHDTP